MNDNTDNTGEIVFTVIAIGIGLLVFGLIGRLIGQKRGQSEKGAAMGALLGPVGLVGAAFLPDKRRQCPACKGHVPDDARKCMHCGEDLPVKPAPTSARALTFELYKEEYCGEIPLRKYGRVEQEAMFKQWRARKIESLGFKNDAA